MRIINLFLFFEIFRKERLHAQNKLRHFSSKYLRIGRHHAHYKFVFPKKEGEGATMRIINSFPSRK